MTAHALMTLLIGGLSLVGCASPVPLIFAHRGDTSVAPENSVAAIAVATTWADGVEMDVWLAPDGTWRLSHDPPTDWQSLPTLEQGVAAAGDLLLDLDLKEQSLAAHAALGRWIEEHRIAARTTVNVKSIEGARAIRAIAAVTIEAQPEWVPSAATAPEVDIVLVWGADWRDVLAQRPPYEVALFVSSVFEAGMSRWDEARGARVGRYFADGQPASR